MIIYLLRHTKPEVPEATFYGQTDIDVVPGEFDEKVNMLRRVIPMKNIDAIISSPLKRCYKLAAKLAGDKPIQREPRIMELNFGDWEMQNWEKMDRSTLEEWSRDFVNNPTPNGESHRQMYDRATEFWHDLLKKDLKNVLVVTHAGVIRSLLSFVLDMPLKKSFSIKLHYNVAIRIDPIKENHYNLEFLTC
jgi:alpha-ribazole phosphatase